MDNSICKKFCGQCIYAIDSKEFLSSIPLETLLYTILEIYRKTLEFDELCYILKSSISCTQVVDARVTEYKKQKDQDPEILNIAKQGIIDLLVLWCIYNQKELNSIRKVDKLVQILEYVYTIESILLIVNILVSNFQNWYE